MTFTMLSTYPFTPLSASYIDSNIDLKPQLQQYSDGLVVIQNPIFTTKDASFSKNTLLNITPVTGIESLFKDTNQVYNVNIQGLFAIYVDLAYVTVTNDTLYATETSLTNADYFDIINNLDGSYSMAYGGKYVTVDSAAPWKLVLNANPTNNLEKFVFVQYGNNFIIRTYTKISNGGVSFYRFITRSNIDYSLQAAALVPSSHICTLVPQNVGNNYVSHQEYSGYSPNTWWYRYQHDLTNKDNNSNVEPNISRSVSGVNLNYLVNSPYRGDNIGYTNTIDSQKIGSIDIDISNLKNSLTPNYSYSDKNGVNNRSYQKLFVDSQKEGGYENIFLGYDSSAIQIKFAPDKITYFHYPNTSTIPLSTSGLIECGATPGLTPYRADKIWKKSANYKKYIFWGDSGQPQTGVWLCSWLSGMNTPDFQPKWKDRWYNPGYIDEATAMFIQTAASGVIIDIDSQMTFDPRVWYKYFHMGNNTNEYVVDNFIGYNDSLKYHFDNIKEFDGTSYYQASYDTSYYVSSAITFAAWIKNDNWSQIKGSHIISNGFRGGWNIKYNNGFLNFTVPIYDDQYGYIMNFDTVGDAYNSKTLPPSCQITWSGQDQYMYTWYTDNYNKKLYKVDFNGDIVNQILFNSNVSLDKFIIDGSNNIHVLDSTNHIISSINMNGGSTTTIAVPWNISQLDVDSTNTIQYTDGDDICIDNNDDVWKTTSTAIWKNGVIVKSINGVSKLYCDQKNYIWGLMGNRDYVKFNNSAMFVLSGMIGDIDTSSYRSIAFTNEYNSGQYKDYIWIVQNIDKKLYKLNYDGTLIKSINITDNVDLTYINTSQFDNMRFNTGGDFTGYSWHRKYGGLTPQIQTQLYLGHNSLQQKITLSHNLSCFTDREWHHVLTTYNANSKTANLYIDTVLRDTETVSIARPLYYEYESGITLGANVGKGSVLEPNFMSQNYYYNGAIADVRIYDNALNISDIICIYNLMQEFRDVEWDALTGLQNYIEEIYRFFKYKLPGMKSQFYNIRISGMLSLTSDTKSLVESIVRNTVKKVAPAYTELYKIIWD